MNFKRDKPEAIASHGKRNGRLILTGNENIPSMPMTDAQVNHLRLMLAWMRCEWMIDDDMQRGFVEGAAICVQNGYATPDQARNVLIDKADKINHCPAYVRHAVKMLTKALRDHDLASGIVDTKDYGDAQNANQDVKLNMLRP